MGMSVGSVVGLMPNTVDNYSEEGRSFLRALTKQEQSQSLDGAERVRLARLARFQRSSTATRTNTGRGNL